MRGGVTLVKIPMTAVASKEGEVLLCDPDVVQALRSVLGGRQ
jgi:hypothetical protein